MQRQHRPAILPDQGSGSQGEAAPSPLTNCALGSCRRQGAEADPEYESLCLKQEARPPSSSRRHMGAGSRQQGILRGESHMGGKKHVGSSSQP